MFCNVQQVFVDAAQPPPLKSAWSSIVKSHPKQRDVPGQTSAAPQPAKQTAPSSPSRGTKTAVSPDQDSQTPSPTQPDASTAVNGRQTSPRANKDASSPALANGFASPSSAGESNSAAAAEGSVQATDTVDRQPSTSSATSAQLQVCTLPGGVCTCSGRAEQRAHLVWTGTAASAGSVAPARASLSRKL